MEGRDAANSSTAATVAPFLPFTFYPGCMPPGHVLVTLSSCRDKIPDTHSQREKYLFSSQFVKLSVHNMVIPWQKGNTHENQFQASSGQQKWTRKGEHKPLSVTYIVFRLPGEGVTNWSVDLFSNHHPFILILLSPILHHESITHSRSSKLWKNSPVTAEALGRHLDTIHNNHHLSIGSQTHISATWMYEDWKNVL